MNSKFEYIAFFVDAKELYQKTALIRKNPLPNVPKYPHVTISFNPDCIHEYLFGTQAKITITGYGNDGQNEGVCVKLDVDNAILKELIMQVKIPHITLAIDNNAKAVNTSQLSFSPIEPIEIQGTFGAFIIPEQEAFF